MKFSEQFFPSEVTGTQDVILNVPEPQERVKTNSPVPSVLAKTPGRTTLVKHYIKVGDAVSVQQKPYRIPYSQRELIKKELDRMLEARVIRPSTSPWASPIVLVPKIKFLDVHFCVDYQKPNQLARFDAYPMPKIEMIDTMGSARVISILDLAKGYW